MTIEWRTPALLALGWSEARAPELAPLLARGLVPARVVAQHRSHYIVSDGMLDRRAARRARHIGGPAGRRRLGGDPRRVVAGAHRGAPLATQRVRAPARRLRD